MFPEFYFGYFPVIFEVGEEGAILPPSKAEVFRENFTAALWETVCRKKGNDCWRCAVRFNCPYAYLIENISSPYQYHKYGNVPRPFVFEPPTEKKTLYQEGEKLKANLVLLGRAVEHIEELLPVFQAMGEKGLGKGKSAFRLVRVSIRNPIREEETTLYSGGKAEINGMYRHLTTGKQIMEWAERYSIVSRITLQFLTPVRLKYHESYVENPSFRTIVQSLLRQISLIYYIYHGRRELEVDYEDFLQLAEKVRLVKAQTSWAREGRLRHSKKEGRQVTGGVVGGMQFAGEVGNFLALLKLGEFTHLGEGVEFGLGRYRLHKALKK